MTPQTAGQAALAAYEQAVDDGKNHRVAMDCAAEAARAWKEPTLGQLCHAAFHDNEPRSSSNWHDAYQGCWEAAAQAVASAERAACRQCVMENHPSMGEILAAIDARGKDGGT
jgi:hypothetical protein